MSINSIIGEMVQEQFNFWLFGVFNMQQVFLVLQEYYCSLEELVDVLFQSTRTQRGRNKERYTPRKINMEPENASRD